MPWCHGHVTEVAYSWRSSAGIVYTVSSLRSAMGVAHAPYGVMLARRRGACVRVTMHVAVCRAARARGVDAPPTCTCVCTGPNADYAPTPPSRLAFTDTIVSGECHRQGVSSPARGEACILPVSTTSWWEDEAPPAARSALLSARVYAREDVTHVYPALACWRASYRGRKLPPCRWSPSRAEPSPPC